MNSNEKKYDVIVIGSGIGGMTTASLLAKLENKKVLLLEQHFSLGGFTDIFERKGMFEWDVGLHYIGNMNPGDSSRAAFDYVTEGNVDWFRMPEVYDKYIFPDFTFDVQTGIENFRNDLINQFPNEKEAIDQYFVDIDKVKQWVKRYGSAFLLPKFLKPVSWFLSKFGQKMAHMTTGEYLDSHFKDEKLKAVLVGQWGLYGLPPGKSSFIPHASVTSHYANGGFYPVGSSIEIINSIIGVLKKYGGEVKLNHSVDEIIVENGKAIGVQVTHKKGKKEFSKTFFADTIISNAGALTTYTKLMPKNVKLPFEFEVNSFPDGTANVTLFLGLNNDPELLGVKGENYWFYDSYDHDEMYSDRNKLKDGYVNSAFLSFPSMKNPQSKGHTAEIIAFMDIEPFQEWRDTPWKDRGDEYEKLKEKISDALIEFVEERLPGLEELIAYKELATPLTVEDFTGHPRGIIYGLPSYPDRFKAKWMGPTTPIKNFYLTGADAGSFGIIGALMSGILAVGVSIGKPLKVISIMKDAIKYSRKLHNLGDKK